MRRGTSRRLRPLLVVGMVALAACAGTARAPAPRPTVPPPPPPAPARPLIGVVVPQSGSPALVQYGDLVLQGVRLALDSASRTGPELLVLDDGGDAERDPELLRQAAARGAVAVIGPLLSPGLAGAARARADTALVLISPTASTVPRGLPNVYSLNVPDEEGMAALARWAVREGATRMALLYPQMAEFAAKAQAFSAAFRAARGTIVADVPYDSGTTTFRLPLRRVADASPEGLAVFAPERDVRQLAPQIAYYGVSGKGLRIFGGESWTGEEILRLVDPRYTNGVVASTPLVRESPAAGWQDFARLYETRYKRTLDTPFPALGYDAARLILDALPHRSAPRAEEVARRLATLRGFRGATGVLAVKGGALVREPFLVRIEEGHVVPLVTPTTEGAATR